MSAIYLDNSATTPTDPRVFTAMLPYFEVKFGNPSSKYHAQGREAAKAIFQAKAQVVELFGAESPDDVIFTSGATESISMVTNTLGEFAHVITSAVEHKATLSACELIIKRGGQVSVAQPNQNGQVLARSIHPHFTSGTTLVTVMAANNETGVINDIEALCELSHNHGALFHTDATQYAGKMKVRDLAKKADIISCAGHKIYGPKGVGVMIANKKARQLLDERARSYCLMTWPRAGTMNVPGIVGFAAALALAEREQESTARRLNEFRGQVEHAVRRIPGSGINGGSVERVPGVSSVSFQKCDVDALMMVLDNYSLSSGSACNSHSNTPSHVLKAMGLSDEEAKSTVRISIGKFNSQEEIDSFCDDLPLAVNQVRSALPENS